MRPDRLASFLEEKQRVRNSPPTVDRVRPTAYDKTAVGRAQESVQRARSRVNSQSEARDSREGGSSHGSSHGSRSSSQSRGRSAAEPPARYSTSDDRDGWPDDGDPAVRSRLSTVRTSTLNAKNGAFGGPPAARSSGRGGWPATQSSVPDWCPTDEDVVRQPPALLPPPPPPLPPLAAAAAAISVPALLLRSLSPRCSLSTRRQHCWPGPPLLRNPAEPPAVDPAAPVLLQIATLDLARVQRAESMRKARAAQLVHLFGLSRNFRLRAKVTLAIAMLRQSKACL